MKKYISFLFILAVLFVSGIVSWKLYFKTYTQEDTVNIHIFPKTIGEWQAEELTISEDEYELLETKNAFARRYKTPLGKEVELFVVYSQNNRKVSHPPEVCYAGGGLMVIGKTVEPIPLQENNEVVEAIRLFLEYGNFQQISYYWYKVGNQFIASYWKQQLQLAVKSLMGESASGALIRVSVSVKDGNITQAKNDAKEFTGVIAPYLLKYLP